MLARIPVLVVACVVVSCAAPHPLDRSLIEFCHMPVREMLRRGNATFQVEFMFTVTAGRPAGVRTVQNPASLDTAEGEACLARWHVGFIPNRTQVNVTFQWRHAVGWESLEMAWLDHRLLLPVTGERCPYCG